MLATSGLLLGAVIISLPADADSRAPVIESLDDEEGGVPGLLDGPDSIVLPVPGGGERTVSVVVNHRRSGVGVTSRLANGDGLAVELSEVGARATDVTITTTAVHRCGRYAGSLILEASHDEHPGDLEVIDLRFAECEEPMQVAMGPASAHDLERTWGDDGRAPWDRSRTTAPPPPEPVTEPEPEPEPTTESEPEPEPEAPTETETTEPTAEPTDEPTDEPTADPTSEPASEPASEPTAEPTGEPTADPPSEPAAEPSPSETATGE